MKTKVLFPLAAMMIFIAVGCGGPQGEKAKVSEAKSVDSEMKGTEMMVNTDKSQIGWLGSKPTGQHFGAVNVSSGEIWMEDGQIEGGKFLMDMTSILVEDIKDEEMNQKLTNHLKSTDFFNVEKYPQAEFVITDVADWQGGQVEEGESGNMITPTHEITGNLTIKGISKSITFPAIVKMNDKEFSAYTPQFIVDRTDWDIKFKSRKFFDDLKDNFIFDDIGLKIILNASAKS